MPIAERYYRHYYYYFRFRLFAIPFISLPADRRHILLLLMLLFISNVIFSLFAGLLPASLWYAFTPFTLAIWLYMLAAMPYYIGESIIRDVAYARYRYYIRFFICFSFIIICLLYIYHIHIYAIFSFRLLLLPLFYRLFLPDAQPIMAAMAPTNTPADATIFSHYFAIRTRHYRWCHVIITYWCPKIPIRLSFWLLLFRYRLTFNIICLILLMPTADSVAFMPQNTWLLFSPYHYYCSAFTFITPLFRHYYYYYCPLLLLAAHYSLIIFIISRHHHHRRRHHFHSSEYSISFTPIIIFIH